MKRKSMPFVVLSALLIASLSGCGKGGGNDSLPTGDYFDQYINYSCPVFSVKEKTVTVSTSDELLAAVAEAGAGTTIVVADGTYTNVELIVENCGTKDKNIVIKAEHVGKAIFTGMTTIRIVGSHVVLDGFLFEDGAAMSQTGVILAHGHHIRITNNEINNFNGADPNENKKWVGIYGKFVEVDHNYFHGKSSIGALLTVWRPNQEPNYAYIHDNHIADFSNPQEADNELEPIRIGTSEASQSDSYTIVENNYFSNLAGEIEVISSKSGRNVIRNNTAVDCEGLFTLRHGSNNLVEGNYFDPNFTKTGNAQGGGIRFYDGGHVIRNNYIQNAISTSDSRSAILVHSGNNPVNEENRYLNAQWTPHDILIENNTVIESTQSIQYDVKFGYDADNITFKNNFIYTTKTNIIRKGVKPPYGETRKPTNLTFSGDVFYGQNLANDSEYEAPAGLTYHQGVFALNSANDPSKVEGDIRIPKDNSAIGARNVKMLTPADVGLDKLRRNQPNKTVFDRAFFEDNFANWPTAKRELTPPSVLKESINLEFHENNKTSATDTVIEGRGVQYLPTDNDFVDIENNIGIGLNSQTSGSSMLRVKANADATKGRISYLRFAIPEAELNKTNIYFNFAATYKGKAGTTQDTSIYILDDYENWVQGRISWLNTPRHLADNAMMDLITENYVVDGENHSLTAQLANVVSVDDATVTGKLYRVDITDVAKLTDGVFTIMMIDESKANVDVDFYSKERSGNNAHQRPFISFE